MMENIIKKLLADHQEKHSDFQIDNFIVGGQGDTWAQYKQALREIAGRRDSLQALKEDLELLELERRRFKFFRIGERAQAAARIAAARRIRKRAAMVQSIAQTERELKRFVGIALELKNAIGDIDKIRRRELEAESWARKARKMAAVDIFLSGSLSRQTMDFLLSFPKEQRKMIFSGFESVTKDRLLDILIDGK